MRASSGARVTTTRSVTIGPSHASAATRRPSSAIRVIAAHGFFPGPEAAAAAQTSVRPSQAQNEFLAHAAASCNAQPSFSAAQAS